MSFFNFLKSSATIIPDSLASKVAKNLYFERVQFFKQTKYSDIEIRERLVFANEKIPVYYIFNIGDKEGFVIISADDKVFPVLGYSFSGFYERDNQPPALIDWMRNYEFQILDARKNQLEATMKIKDKWTYYLKDNFVANVKSVETIAPLIQTQWDQVCYYNAQCPSSNGHSYFECGHVPVGCVAVAMAQIMKYHNYPNYGSRSISYVDPANMNFAPDQNDPSYGTISVNFANTNYKWANMPNKLNNFNDDVATLLFHCGASVKMDYSYKGSGSDIFKAQESFVKYFNYYLSTHVESKNTYTNEQWINILKNEINARRPMYYRGTGEAGHAFVCDGYQDDGHFHFNWGWNGSEDGWFFLNNLNPSGSNYTNNQMAIVGIQPVPRNLLLGNVVCNEENLNLSVIAAPGTSYSWNLPTGFLGASTSNVISVQTPPTGNGTQSYSVTVSKNIGGELISQTIGGYLWLGRPSDPPKVVFARYGNMCAYQGTISAPGATSYFWSEDGNSYVEKGTKYGIFEPYSTVTLFVKSKNRCAISFPIQTIKTLSGPPSGCLWKSDTESQDDFSLHSSTISVFPNPTNGILQINAKTGITKIVLTNLSGKEVLSQTLNSFQNSQTIDLTLLSAGIYILRVCTKTEVIVQKIVLTKN